VIEADFTLVDAMMGGVDEGLTRRGGGTVPHRRVVHLRMIHFRVIGGSVFGARH